ncbi:YbhB/YbcL family Raf kinase inhibitor-like protein [Ensifer canadensis]
MNRFHNLVVAASMLIASAAQAADFTVTSPDFAEGKVQQAQFAANMGCTGKDLSPAISWANAPEGTKSFVVTLYDKDAPTGSGWWHWVAIDIPADVTALDGGAGSDISKMPAGAVTIANDAGQRGFGGACPPEGEVHDYTITVKALSVDKLPVPPGASPALVGFVSNMNTLASATVSAKGSR